MRKKTRRPICTKNDFHLGDMIEYYYIDDDTLKGRIIELYENTAKIEINIPSKKSGAIENEIIEVFYREIIPLSKLYKGIKVKKDKEVASNE